MSDDKKLFAPCRSSKICSTISYNTEPFLKSRLDNLIKSGILDFYAYIFHKGELDSTTNKRDKDHFHVYMVPNGRIDRSQLKVYFQEIVVGNDKPLGFVAIVNSKFYDWYYYCCHNERYLEQKNPNEANKEFHYSRNDFVVSDLDYFNSEISSNLFQYTPNDLLKKAILSNPNASSLELAFKVNPNVSMKNLHYVVMSINDCKDYLYRSACDDIRKEKEIEEDCHKDSDEIVLDSGEVIDSNELPW